MLNAETKRHIDAARDVLVGVAPNPMTQIDQITYALIYKFMDDMDQAAIKAGGDPSFFTGDLEPYAWSRLVDSRIGNQEKMNLYGEALQKFAEAKQLPELFRTIFRSAFLPYRSPETLGLFLKEINFFDYTHPEELGNAYEYLLSIMSAQGDAGQFRTPRHIIDFIVDVINPTKDDTVLDPACGTGGFLVSSYNHILEQHQGKSGSSKQEKPLTPDERKKLMNNLEGYDIDPSMVRIAQVNMYLHQFKNPKIFQYDSLTSEERWSDKFDVILANPPFMSPKGGIKPHSKFALQSNRSEVLFVDYIVNHLKPGGRAGIIVPEGIIFQSGKAYKQLRKELVEGGLYAVVSLPSGVFNPYSGVKTSILLVDNSIAKQNENVLFIKIAADGYDLGATKRPIEKNDLPSALEIIRQFASNKFQESPIASLISRTKIAMNEDFNLSLEKYSGGLEPRRSSWPVVELSEVAKIGSGNSAPQGDQNFRNGTYPFFRTSDVGSVHLSNNLVSTRDKLTPEATVGMRLFPAKTILFPKSGASTFLNHRAIMGVPGYVSSHLATITTDPNRLLPEFAYYLLASIDARTLTADQSYPSLRLGDIEKIKIPLPPVEIQKQVASELDGYFAVITGANEVIRSWMPRLEIRESFHLVRLGDFVQIDKQQGNYEGLPYVGLEDIEPKTGRFIGDLTPRKVKSSTYKFGTEHVLLGQLRPYLNKYLLPDFVGHCSTEIQPLLPSKTLKREFLAYWLSTKSREIDATSYGARMPRARMDQVLEMEIPIPSLEEQEYIVQHLKSEQATIHGLRSLINSYEQLAENTIAAIWE
jgi:type I restriction enzyme M protein